MLLDVGIERELVSPVIFDELTIITNDVINHAYKGNSVLFKVSEQVGWLSICYNL